MFSNLGEQFKIYETLGALKERLDMLRAHEVHADTLKIPW